MHCSYIIPTRNRHDALHETLQGIGALGTSDSQVIVIDNASDSPVRVDERLADGTPVEVVRLETNHGAAARNAGAERARGDWLVMLDDDSVPLSAAHESLGAEAPLDVGAIGAEILLEDGSHEAGGLPEVFVGCGVMIRTDVFRALGGYDASFGYYAEEYDLAARMLLAGLRVVHDHRFIVRHRKIASGRDMQLILRRLVRNNSWVDLRYAPDECVCAALARTASRYERIARKEHAMRGYRAGLKDLASSADQQPRTPMSVDMYERFTGLSYARAGAMGIAEAKPGARVRLVSRGKNDWAIEHALRDAGCVLAADAEAADLSVVATLSPGPVLDALDAVDEPARAIWHPARVA